MKKFIVFLSYFFVTANLGAQPVYKEYSIQAVNYFQTAAEVKALQIQAYNFAKVTLDLALTTQTVSKPLAVILDIDETVLDNSPYQARQITSGESYPKGWKEWIEEAKATPIPGSLEFLTYADEKHVTIFYVSNRKLADIPATMRNLSATGFPQVTESQMIFKEKENSKEIRRKKIQEKYEVVVLVGDNLADFSDLFDGKSVQEREQAVDSLKKEFGSRFIMLPNSLYGDWESALFNWNFGTTEAEKSEIRLKSLKK
ncbi:MAG: 5'-nucleotidase, lipoprotein e(P4) family [Bacteroidetes bacterium]|nr:5'-nucleotidase, lipoprotein e(P4) family [Bacteroidota bacterium]